MAQDALQTTEPKGAQERGSQVARQWAAVQDAASAVAMIAGVEADAPSSRSRNFAASVAAAGGDRQRLAENALSDIAAVLQPGLAALLAVNARGQDAAAPALALWREYCASRDALLSLVPEVGSRMGPRRSA
ncbi:hypothetical protein [Erythrobacter sp. HKB08]|uniref:hypothetical protein n=1 Tax=Erythrobacter sp. HKB08 TaxID=2502843 RepID=UPI0010088DCB|nr:hypothetical protein [Erythrobacter sp. HKB08]